MRRFALAHALLAPNPHNMQPWIADLGTDGQIGLRLDMQRLLPATDPFGRQILMGAGAFLELLAMAAAARGYRAEIGLFPDGAPGERLDAKRFALVRLIQDAAVAPDPLFANVPSRRTDRRGYDLGRPIGPEDAAALAAAAGGTLRFGLAGATDPRVEAIRAIAREAWRIELATAATMMESMHVLRVGGAEIDRHRDGISITDPLLFTLMKLGMFDRSAAPAIDSAAMRKQVADFDAITAATPGYFWIVSDGNSRAQQIAAGRAFARVALAGVSRGLVMHPNEQSLQEYPEVATQYRAIHALIGAGGTVQMLARVGALPAGTAVAEPAPRRGLPALLGTEKMTG
ncbi:MAG: twin-arginine translocation pathway signal protein [Alphaproteobacteria bacterium]|nr:twin-arginine translocation pathway signal protein [Alphaproteobacteria bacterium]